MTAALKLVPAWMWVVLVMAASIGYLAFRLDAVKADRDAVTAQRDTATAKAESLVTTLRLQRQITQDVNEAADNAKVQADRVVAAVAVADERADGLQQHVDRLLAARKTCDSKVASGGQARVDFTVLLADLRRSADETAGRLAAALDRSRIAGLACEAAFAAVRAE